MADGPPERIAYLGPAGTFTEDALGEALGEAARYEPVRTATIHDAFEAVVSDRADRAFAPFENSIEGSVRSSLDALALDVGGLSIVGEHDYRVRPHLIAREELSPAGIRQVISHPQPLSQCARYLRAELPGAELVAASSTAQAVLEVSRSREPVAALGSRAAAELYGCVALSEAAPDSDDNVTRFVWVAPAGTDPGSGELWKTSIVFSELGADHPGALVEALEELSGRGVNLSRIESRPLRTGLGRYMFFIDIEGSARQAEVAAALEGLRAKASQVKILGSYPVPSGAP